MDRGKKPQDKGRYIHPAQTSTWQVVRLNMHAKSADDGIHDACISTWSAPEFSGAERGHGVRLRLYTALPHLPSIQVRVWHVHQGQVLLHRAVEKERRARD
jgi:hypothetical protein